ncbi:MAG: hypothetical protein ACMXYC_01745 [Candidatus Woesearchaeota archaeon]
MKNVIITACDAKYGDFFIQHWLRSLQENINLKKCDVVVLDYGFTQHQRDIIDTKGIIRKECVRDGHVVIIRFRDIAKFLEQNTYDQVLMCDSGDIIFQADITEVFNTYKNYLRASYDTTNVVFQAYINPLYFSSSLLLDLQKSLLKHRMINAGVLVGPADLFKKISYECYEMIDYKKHYGPDQVAIHYLLHKYGFKKMHEKFNCVVMCTTLSYVIKQGKFYDKKGKLIPIIHNAGKTTIIRGIKNFGYGCEYNQPKIGHRVVIKPFHTFSRFIFDSKFKRKMYKKYSTYYQKYYVLIKHKVKSKSLFPKL